MVDDELFTSQQDICNLICKHPKTFEAWLRIHPLDGKINGRWCVRKSVVMRWLDELKAKLDRRHPAATHMRPVEAPDLQRIKGR